MLRNKNPDSHIVRLFGLSVDLYSAILITVAKGVWMASSKTFDMERAESETTCRFPISRARKPIATFYKIKDNIHLDISVSENAQKRFFQYAVCLGNENLRSRNPSTGSGSIVFHFTISVGFSVPFFLEPQGTIGHPIPAFFSILIISWK
jgi:hypothetical protein